MSSAAGVMPLVCAFAGTPEEVSSVRRFVGQLIEGCPVADDVILLASELAANAVRHTSSGAGGTFSVAVQLADGYVRVEVHDQGSVTAPAVRRSESPRESGNGLAFVESVASRWGFSGGQPGRVVWFEVDCPSCPSFHA